MRIVVVVVFACVVEVEARETPSLLQSQVQLFRQSPDHQIHAKHRCPPCEQIKQSADQHVTNLCSMLSLSESAKRPTATILRLAHCTHTLRTSLCSLSLSLTPHTHAHTIRERERKAYGQPCIFPLSRSLNWTYPKLLMLVIHWFPCDSVLSSSIFLLCVCGDKLFAMGGVCVTTEGAKSPIGWILGNKCGGWWEIPSQYEEERKKNKNQSREREGQRGTNVYRKWCWLRVY